MSFEVLGSRIRAIGAALCLLAAQSAVQITQATTVTVQELSTSPNKIVNIQVQGFYSGYAYAGVVNMLVDGTLTQGFCIDPFHFSSQNPLQYEVVPLAEAPKALAGVFPGDMGEAKADQIERLWAMAYLPNSPTWGGAAAAALQIAIWEIVAGDKFTVVGNDYGAAALLNQLNSYTGPGADLVGLTGPGQDYVISRVPEAGATLLMLFVGVGSLFLVKRFRTA
jgi:hypothetical protein